MANQNGADPRLTGAPGRPVWPTPLWQRVDAPVVFAGLVPPFARLYQLNVTMPDAAPNGDQAVVAEIGGVSPLKSDTCRSITVQR